ncbi:MAG TPA: thioredoxin family protein [Phycisphaerae bacterium]|nr:thioredoxin family protein [Phycisphaerae bacterium]
MKQSSDSREKPWQPSSPAVEAEVFADVIEGPTTIVHFWAPWNPYDKPLDANLQQLGPQYKRFRFFSVNTDQTAFTAIVEQHHVAALPTLLCFVNGRVRGRFHGLQTLEELKKFLDEMAQPPQR